ncbi:ABC transporter permease [Acidobacteriota bacterium]
MFKNYFVISIRNLFKNKWFSIINLVGLAVGIACFVFIMAYIRQELSYDRFFDRAERIYRVLSAEGEDREEIELYRKNSSEPLGTLLHSEFPEIADTTRIYTQKKIKSIVQRENTPFFVDGIIADRQFLEIFSFPLLSGSPSSALDEPMTIVLSENTANKLFGTEDPLGQIIAYREKNKTLDMKITGVIGDVPQNSHLSFDFIVSLETLRADERNEYMFNNWNVGNFITYVELAPNTVKETVEEKFPGLIKERGLYPDAEGGVHLFLQPIQDIHLKSKVIGERSTNNEMRYIYIFGSIAFIILLIACINYMNLSTARSSTRAKEVGVRKVNGAIRSQLFKQFIGESVLTALIAAVLAVGLIYAFLPQFRQLIGIDLNMDFLKNVSLSFLIVGAVIGVGILSGIYPALILSGFHPVKVFKERNISGNKGSTLRNILVVVQFSASVILIVGTLVILRQMNYVKNEELGYDREHVVVLPLQDEETRQKAQLIKGELMQLPMIQKASVTRGLPLDIGNQTAVRLTNNQGESVLMWYWFEYVDHEFLDVFDIELAKGRDFREGQSKEGNEVLINETLASEMGWSEPLGKSLSFITGDFQVIGVVKDFYFATFHKKIEPMALFPFGRDNIAVRINPGDVPKTISGIREVFERNTNSQPFDFFFLEDSFNQLYRKEQRSGKIFGTFAVLAVFVACMGLFGLASFTVERRTKEIGIRRVLGASGPHIIANLSSDFIKLILISNAIAWPLAYIFMNKWMMGFTYRVGISAWTFLAASLTALLIAFLTISFQTIKAAFSNPADIIRYE